jgi:hypothetical protein
MATSRRGANGVRNGWRRLSAMELTLAVGVIVGLLFVSLRIKSMDWPPTPAHSGTMIVGNETVPLTPQAPGTKTP